MSVNIRGIVARHIIRAFSTKLLSIEFTVINKQTKNSFATNPDLTNLSLLVPISDFASDRCASSNEPLSSIYLIPLVSIKLIKHLK